MRKKKQKKKTKTEGQMAGGWYTENRNLAAESYPGCYGIAGFKACKTNFP